MHTNAHSQAIENLRALGPLRVWSLLVTVFGDLAPDCALDGPTLSAIMEGVGIRPEATRVALHRLRSDNWIASEKTGRTSLHRLTDKGQRDSAAAHLRIYGTPSQMAHGADVFVMPHTDNVPDPALYAQIAPRLFMTTSGMPLPDGAMHLAPMGFPHWLGLQIETAPLREAYADLHATLIDIDTSLLNGTILPPLETATLRVMIVHAWRRLALKHPDLPRDAHSKDWRGHDCRTLVTGLLSRFPHPAVDGIKTA